MVIFTIKGIEYVHISDFAKATHRGITSTRHLIEKGNLIRRLKALRIRSMLFIPEAEISGYPFAKDSKIYHYNAKGERFLCEECTFTKENCPERQIADWIEVPDTAE